MTHAKDARKHMVTTHNHMATSRWHIAKGQMALGKDSREDGDDVRMAVEAKDDNGQREERPEVPLKHVNVREVRNTVGNDLAAANQNGRCGVQKPYHSSHGDPLQG